MATKPICKIDGCGKPHFGRGWCNAHYERWRRHGDPFGGSTRAPDGEPERYFREVVLTYEGDECLPWPYAKNEHGYGRMNGCLVSRRVCEETKGPPPTPAHEAAHSCGKGHLACVTKGHLSWKTHAENQTDKLIHGTDNRGQKHMMVKLTEDDVREIRALRGTMLQREIARQFGISQQSVGDIFRRATWGWLE